MAEKMMRYGSVILGWIKQRGVLSVAVIWVFLWVFPMPLWLEITPWIRLALTLFMFIVPGTAISLLFTGPSTPLPGHAVTGLGISIFLVGVMGLLGRILNLPFGYIKFFFIGVGLVALFFLVKKNATDTNLYAPSKYSAWTVLSVVLVLALSVVNSLSQRFGGDDFHYLAYVTSWQHADPLNFQRVFNGMVELDRVRYWINMFPMNLAFWADTSGLHGLLLNGLYLEPFLVVLSLIVSFFLYEQVLGSERKAVAAVLMHFIFLLLFQRSFQFGSAFFNRLSEDKGFAAYILAPIFFYLVIRWGRKFDLRGGVLLVVVGWALGLTHPVILAYTVFIGGICLFVSALIQKNYKDFASAILLCTLILLPPSMLRLVDIPFVAEILEHENVKLPGAWDLENAITRTNVENTRITRIEGTRFYGFNVDIVRYREKEGDPPTIFSWFYAYIIVAGFVWALLALKKRSYAPFVFSASLLILVTGIPYTGWLMGQLVSLRMLWRAPWVVPIGLILFILLMELYQTLSERRVRIEPKYLPALNGIGMVLLLGVVFYISGINNNVRWRALQGLPAYRGQLERYVGLGEYLEETLDAPSRFASNRNLMNYLPGLSSKSKVFLFHSGGIISGNVRERPLLAPLLSADPSHSVAERREIMAKNRLMYILTENPSLGDYYLQHPGYFNVHEINGFWIIEFRFLNP